MRLFTKTAHRRTAYREIQKAFFWLAPLAFLLLAQTPALSALKTIPNAVGQKLATAQRILLQDKLQFEAVPEYTFFPGEHLKVFRQYPRPGSPPGGWNGVVKIWYYDKDLRSKKAADKGSVGSGSRISNLISVPVLGGLPLSQALDKLREAGLLSNIAGTVYTHNRKLMLTVADQNPPAGTPVPPRSTVSIYLFRLREYKTPREIQKELRKKYEVKSKETSPGQD